MRVVASCVALARRHELAGDRAAAAERALALGPYETRALELRRRLAR